MEWLRRQTWPKPQACGLNWLGSWAKHFTSQSLVYTMGFIASSKEIMREKVPSKPEGEDPFSSRYNRGLSKALSRSLGQTHASSSPHLGSQGCHQQPDDGGITHPCWPKTHQGPSITVVWKGKVQWRNEYLFLVDFSCPRGLKPSPPKETHFGSDNSTLYNVGLPQLWAGPSIQKPGWPLAVRDKALEWSHYMIQWGTWGRGGVWWVRCFWTWLQGRAWPDA